jgi:hypothetical protein
MASAYAILARIPAVRGLMADTLSKEGMTMAANRPTEGNNGTVTYMDRVIDSRITKKAKRKTLSLADILQPTTQNEDTTDETTRLRTDYNNEHRYGTDPSNYRNPSVQQAPETHPTECEGLKLLADILEISADKDRPEPMVSENIPPTPRNIQIVSENIPTSSHQQCTSVRKREYERVPPIQMLRGQKQYDMEEVLQSIQPEISLAQLLDASATLRQQLYCLLRSIIPRTR